MVFIKTTHNILPKAFWSAFLKGVYLEYHTGIIAFNLESYADLLEGIGYTVTLYGSDYGKDWDFFINAVCVKGIALISLHSIAQPDRLIGSIEINPRRKFKKEKRLLLSYFRKKVKKLPEALAILRELGREIFTNTNIELKEIERENGTLQFTQLLKIITSSAIWKNLICENSHLILKERAEHIGNALGIDPISVSIYGRYSLEKDVRYEANKVSRPLLNEKSGITELWQKLTIKNPKLLPEEKAEIIGDETNLEPATVANYAKGSTDTNVKREGFKASKKIQLEKFDLTKSWRELLDNNPHWTPRERAVEAAKDLSIGPLTAASYCKESLDKLVKKDSIVAYNIIVDEKYELTNKWALLINSQPDLNPLEHARILAKQLKLSIGYISMVGAYSRNQKVLRESSVAAKLNGVEKHNITERWEYLIVNNPEIGYVERAILIGEATGIDGISAAGYATYSSNQLVKKEANLALKSIAENKKGITSQWKEIHARYPKLIPKEIIHKIARQSNIEPTTVATYGRSSSDKLVKTQCNQAFGELVSSKKDIEGNWDKIKNKNPKLPIKEKIGLLVKFLKISEGTLFIYSRSIKDDILRKGIEKAYYRYIDKKHNITKRWLEMLEKGGGLNFMEKLHILVGETGLAPVTISNIMRRSDNSRIKTLGSRLTGKLLNEKHNLTELWKKKMMDESIKDPSMIAEYLSKELNLEPSTIASYAMYSEDSDVKSSANQAYNQVRERKYNIIEKWKGLRKVPKEKAQILASETGLKEITVSSYARFADDLTVRKEAIKLYTELLNDQEV